MDMWRGVRSVWRGRQGRVIRPAITPRSRELQDEVQDGTRRFRESKAPTGNGESSAGRHEKANSGAVADRGDLSAQRSFLYRVSVKVVRWALYSIVFALLPLIFTAGSALGTETSMSLDELLEKGELVLISVGIAGSAAGEIVDRQGYRGSIIHMILVWLNIFISMLGAWWFSQITTTQREPSMVTNTSLILFFSALVTGFCSIVRSEVR